MTGKMIVIDGNDGSGKATQAEMLRNYLAREDKKVIAVSFPRYTETFFGRILRDVLDGRYGDFTKVPPDQAAILYAGERLESASEINKALEAGMFIVCDRYASSNQIHQGGKIDTEVLRVEFLSWLDRLEFEFFKIPRPDISIYLDVPPSVSEKLMSGKTRDIVENNPQYLENSHKSAQWLIAREPEKWIHVRCTVLGEMRSREEIHEEIVARLKEKFAF